jgi:hypothetical protein
MDQLLSVAKQSCARLPLSFNVEKKADARDKHVADHPSQLTRGETGVKKRADLGV